MLYYLSLVIGIIIIAMTIPRSTKNKHVHWRDPLESVVIIPT